MAEAGSAAQSVQVALSIQEAARFTGLSPDTLRYYERVGLLKPVARQAGGHRRYQPDDLNRVSFLCCLRATGMGIRQLQAFTALATQTQDAQTQDPVQARLDLLNAHRAQVQARMEDMRAALDAIDHKIGHYRALVPAAPLTAPSSHISPSQGEDS